MNAIETAKLAVNAGSFGLNVLIVLMLYNLVRQWLAKLVDALNSATRGFAALQTQLAAIQAQLDRIAAAQSAPPPRKRRSRETTRPDPARDPRLRLSPT